MSSIFDLNERMLSPPSSPVTGSSDSDHSHPLGNQLALEKLALELSMLDLTNATNADGHNSADLAAALLNMQHHQQQQQHSPAEGLVPGSTLNAFTSMLGFSPVAGAHFDDRSKKSQNMTECVPVPSSEHVAEIVGRQGKLNLRRENIVPLTCRQMRGVTFERLKKLKCNLLPGEITTHKNDPTFCTCFVLLFYMKNVLLPNHAYTH
jgi:hypothetical protein